MTTLRDLTADEIAALSGILAKLRPYGAPRWQPAGVRGSLAKIAHFDAADALMAAIRLSQDRSAETPAQIAITSSECWRERVAEPTRRLEVLQPHERCGICSERKDRCRALWANDHEFEVDVKVGNEPERAARIVDSIKSEIQPTTPPPEHKGLDAYLPAERDPRAMAAREAMTNHTAAGELRDNTSAEEASK